MGLMDELVTVIKNYCEVHHIKCRVLKSQIEMAKVNDRYSTIFYFTNKAAGVNLYIDYDILRGFDNEILQF